jgi:ribosomal protein L39E
MRRNLPAVSRFTPIRSNPSAPLSRPSMNGGDRMAKLSQSYRRIPHFARPRQHASQKHFHPKVMTWRYASPTPCARFHARDDRPFSLSPFYSAFRRHDVKGLNWTAFFPDVVSEVFPENSLLFHPASVSSQNGIREC